MLVIDAAKILLYLIPIFSVMLQTAIIFQCTAMLLSYSLLPPEIIF